MTKVEAIKKVLEDNGGIAVWSIIYNQLERYYPNIKKPKDWKSTVRGVLYRDIGKNFKMLDEGLISLIDFDENKLVLHSIQGTSKSIHTNMRIGQELFRKKLLKKLKRCPITGINENKILLASHIKPWALSSDSERLDLFNGFIFSPTIDKLFDRGLITFENNKQIIISSSLSKQNIEKIGIERGKKYLNLPVNNRTKYLEYHRDNIFLND